MVHLNMPAWLAVLICASELLLTSVTICASLLNPRPWMVSPSATAAQSEIFFRLSDFIGSFTGWPQVSNLIRSIAYLNHSLSLWSPHAPQRPKAKYSSDPATSSVLSQDGPRFQSLSVR